MTMRDQIAAIVADLYDSEDVMSVHCALVADAILAALPGMIPDLVWDERSKTYWAAQTATGMAYITQYPGMSKSFALNTEMLSVGYLNTLEDAKAAAEAHHRAAIAQAAGWSTK